jgi:hypothetical protein
VSFTFCYALIFVDTYAHTLLLEVISIFQTGLQEHISYHFETKWFMMAFWYCLLLH